MDLVDDPPHTCNVYTSTHAGDSAGGSVVSYTLSQTGVKCSINMLSGAEQNRFAQMGLTVDYRVGFLGANVTLTRGGKLVSGTRTFHIKSIEVGEAYDDCPALTYANCEMQV